jgi:single-stranded-DNA-specific exonuclease
LLKNDKKISIDDFGFLIGPILNAGGRLDDSNLAVKLLSSNNLNEIKSIGKKLINLNNKRKILEDRVLNVIDYNKIKEENKNVILYYSSSIKEGLIGIIASRLKDIYNKPAIVLTDSNNFLKGSARSIFGFDIGLAIKNAFDYNLILRGGGHKMAAGFSIEKKKLKSFDDFINNYYKKVADKINIKSFYYDAKISGTALNKFLFDDIKKLKPFGSGNPNPLFLIEKLKIKKAKILNDKHISNIFISKNGLSIRGISFNAKKESFSKYLLNYKKEINVVGYLSENFWNNKKTLQLVVRDLII